MTYLQRCPIWFCISVYLTYSIYRGDRFRCLRLKSILAGELKSIITVLLILMLTLQFMWDILLAYLKYQEGYFNYHGTIVTKPFILWTPSHQQKAEAFDYVQCVTFSIEAGIFLLLQSFWNYLSNIVAKKTFMSSFEFRFYIVWALVSVATYPILQWAFRDDPIKREAIPQLTYSCEAFLVACLGIRTHFRFKRVIGITQKNNANGRKNIIIKLSYFKDMNKLMTVILFIYSIGFIILCVDGLLPNPVINQNKFAMDAIMANTNVCTVYLLIILISIFHPRAQYASRNADESTHDDSSMQYAGKALELTANNSNIGRQASSPGYSQSISSNVVSGPGPFPSQMHQPRSIAVEDPYTNKPVMFSMVDLPPIKQQSIQQKMAFQPITTGHIHHGSISSRHETSSPVSSMRHPYDNSSYIHNEQRTISPYSPSWERQESDIYRPLTNTSEIPLNQSKDDSIRDWLWQPPERRNT
ncbi:hypothetical protein RMCBS344292_06534 [Rhizopus microsporus]|nr:hypothetical protein RMCBS344292_06534 [Rhizopus microsporus]